MSSPTDQPSPLFGRWTSIGLAALTGFVFYVSFPGLDAWPFAFVAWVPWMLALRGASARRAVLQGLAAGMVMGVFGFYWLMNMLETFSGFPAALCAIFMLILCAYQAGRYSLLGWLYARAAARGWPAGLVFSAAFAASELAYPLLFPFTFAATMHEVYPLLQVAELGGTILVALVVLACNWGIALIVEQFLIQRRSKQPFSVTRILRGAGLGRLSFSFGVPVLALLYGMMRIVQVDETVHHAEKLRVGIVQANMSLIAKREDVGEGLRRHTKLTKQLVKKEKVELVVWPETSIAGAVDENQAAEYYKQRITRKLGVPSIVGAILTRDVNDARGYVLFNSALLSDHTGTIQGRYDKQYLLAFGEYLPFGESFPVLYEWSPNSSRFSPGTTYKPLPFQNHRIATFICYEDIVPSFINRLMDEDNPELLVNMTNDAWFGDSSEPWEHMALAKLRSVEHRRWLVRSTNSGISGFVDPVGRLTKQTPTFEQAAIAETVSYMTERTVYSRLGDTPWWLLTAVSVVMSIMRRPRRKESAT